MDIKPMRCGACGAPYHGEDSCEYCGSWFRLRREPHPLNKYLCMTPAQKELALMALKVRPGGVIETDEPTKNWFTGLLYGTQSFGPR